jgi:6-pyruvoyltetrahydropterin/6-carboxytetrahydropterin synthase
MFSARVEGTFSSAHNLRGYKGKCEALHGHNWKVVVEARGRKLDSCGMLIDFTKMKSALKDELARLDHCYLNNVAYFKKKNPTSERIAEYLFARLRTRIRGLYAVTVWESDNAAATFYGS